MKWYLIKTVVISMDDDEGVLAIADTTESKLLLHAL